MYRDEDFSLKILENIKKIKPYSSEKYSCDDIGTAALFSDLCKDNIRFSSKNNCWYLWDRCWKKQEDGSIIFEIVQKILNVLITYCNGDFEKPDFELVEKYRKYISSIRKYTSIRNISELMKSTLKINLSEMDTDTYIINTPEMAFNLLTGETLDNTKPFNITKMTLCSLPSETDSLCERWLQFIDEIMSGDNEKAKFLQRALGYSILGANNEECMFVAYGAKTRNGKGTLFSSIAAALGQDYIDSASSDLICETKSGKGMNYNAPQPALAKLVGARIVRMSENSRDVRLDVSSIKILTGRDALVTRALFQNSFTFIPQFTMWLETNHLPAVTDDTIFASNRIFVIEFNEHFTEERQDKSLKDFFAKPENKPTILKWLFDGCKDYLSQGLNPPECVIRSTQNYRRLHDRIGNFIESQCAVGDNFKVQRGFLYSAYSSWCALPENKFKPLGSTTFYNEIANRGFPIKHCNNGDFFSGISCNQ